MRRVSMLFSTPVILLLLLLCKPARAQQLVNVELLRGEKASVTRAVTNNCRAPHTFELTENPDIEWFGVGAASRRLIVPGDRGEFVFEFDSAGMDNGTYTGKVFANCLDCAKESGCGPKGFPYELNMKVTRPADDPALVDIRPDEFVAGQVLAALSVKSRKAAEAAASDLGQQYRLQSLRVFELRSISLFFVHFAILDPAASVASVIRSLELDSLVNYAQYVHRYFISTSTQQRDYADKQYALGEIRADLAQKFSDGKDIKIALLDSWVDTRHRDLRGRVAQGRDFTGEGAGAQDVHGTAIAGIIVAIPHNRFGINGVAPGARIVSFKVLHQTSPSSEPEGTPITVGRGLDFAIRSKFRLINMSHGTTRQDPTVARLVRQARRQGVVVVAAAGNDGPGGRARYPAAMNDEVIAVSAVNNNRESYARGTRGDYIDLAAPGVNVLSTRPRDAFQYGDGSSLAAAHVTGVVALLLSKRPRTPPKRIQTVLEQTSTPLGAGGKDIVFGSGLVDACKALEVLLNRGGLCR